MKNTEEKILQATLTVLAREGYDKATTRKIADEAGVCELTLFRKFKNKENLVRSAYKQSLQNQIEDMENIFITDDKENLEDNLMTLHQHLYEGINERTSQFVAQMRRALVNQNMILHQDPKNTYLFTMRNNLADYFQKQIDLGIMRDINPQAAALMFFSVITFEKILMKTIHDTESGINTSDFMDIFLKGVSK